MDVVTNSRRFLPLGRPAFGLVTLLAVVATGASAAFVPVLLFVPLLLAGAVFFWLTPVRLIIYLSLLLLPFQFYVQIPGAEFTLRAAYVVCAIGAFRVVTRSLWERRSLDASPTELALGAVLVWIAASSTWASQPYLALRGAYDCGAVLSMCSLVMRSARRDVAPSRLVHLLLIGGAVQLALGVVQLLLGQQFAYEFVASSYAPFLFDPSLLQEKLFLGNWNFAFVRGGQVVFISPFGTFPNTIDFAVFVSGLLCFAAARVSYGRKHQGRPLLLGYAALGATLVLLTLKGTGWLAAATGLAVVGLHFFRRLVLWSVPSLVVAAIAFMLLSRTEAYEVLLSRIDFQLGSSSTTGSGLSERLDVWREYLELFGQRPLLGAGMNNGVLDGPARLAYAAGVPTMIFLPAENQYLAFAVDLGSIGLAMFLGVLVLGLRSAYVASSGPADAERASAVGALACLVALIASGITVAGLLGDQIGMLFGFALGLSEALRRRADATST